MPAASAQAPPAPTPTIEYGRPVVHTLEWESPALERMKKIPAFVRGMVTKSVESYCEKNGIECVTAEVLEELRARMPTPRVFSGKPGR